MNYSATALCCFSLAACGGGGSSPAPMATCTPLPLVTVQLYGDSTMNGNGATDAAWTPPVLLQAALDAKWPGRTKVVNSAIAGTSADAGVIGYDGFAPWPTGVVGDVVVANWGINDAPWRAPYPYSQSMEALASRVTLFETPNPVVPGMGADDSLMAQAMIQVAAEHHIPVADTQAYVLSLPNWQLMMVDGVHHPNDALYRMISANVLVPAVMPQVAKLLCD